MAHSLYHTISRHWLLMASGADTRTHTHIHTHTHTHTHAYRHADQSNFKKPGTRDLRPRAPGLKNCGAKFNLSRLQTIIKLFYLFVVKNFVLFSLHPASNKIFQPSFSQTTVNNKSNNLSTHNYKALLLQFI